MSASNKKQGLIQGTLILVAANAVSKILGAIFKIPLTYILQEEGMAVFNTAFSVYATVLTFLLSGMPMAISKMIAEALSLQRQGDARRIVTVSCLILSVLGLLGSSLLFWGADFFALAMKDPKAAESIRFLSPAVFFVALGTVFKSYYQGKVNMIPTAISQVAEAFIKLIAGYGLAVLFAGHGIETTAAWSIFGVTIGEIIATAILAVLYLPDWRKIRRIPARTSVRKICTALSCVAVPMMISAGIEAAMNIADLTMIRSQLLQVQFTPETAERFLLQFSSYTSIFDNLAETLCMDMDGARWLYGAYSGYALTVFHLPVGILATLSVTVLPVLSGALACGQQEKAERTARLSLRLVLLAGLPCAAVLALFAEPILALLFRNTASAPMLRLLSPCLIFICLSQILSTILNAADKTMHAIVHGLIGCGVKLLGNLILIHQPQLHILGAVLSADISYLVILLLDAAAVRRHTTLACPILPLVWKPLLSAAVMCGVMLLLYRPLCVVFAGEIPALFAALFVGAVSYGLMLVLTSAVHREELQILRKSG